MSISTQHDYRDEVDWLQYEVEKLTLLVNKINGLKLIKPGNEEFSLIDDALFSAGEYWKYDINENYYDSLLEVEIYAIIIRDSSITKLIN